MDGFIVYFDSNLKFNWPVKKIINSFDFQNRFLKNVYAILV